MGERTNRNKRKADETQNKWDLINIPCLSRTVAYLEFASGHA
jgi:hypothetical protein